MKKVYFILKKELLCIVRDKKVVVAILMPLIVFPLIYIVLGIQIESGSELLKSDLPIAVIGNISKEEKKALVEDCFPNIKLNDINISDETQADNSLKEEKVFIVLVINKTTEGYSVDIKYNSYSSTSIALSDILSNAYQKVNEKQYDIVSQLHSVEIKKISTTTTDISPNSQLFLMIPMFITMFLFSGISSISVDIFAGEKERNTMESLLITQTSRRVILISKMLTIIVVGTFSAVISVAGYFISIIVSSKVFDAIDLNFFYSIEEYISFFLLIISLTFLATVIFSIISLSSHSIKEGQSISTIITLIPGLLSAVIVSSPSNIPSFSSLSIPIYNVIVLLKSILVGTSAISMVIYVLILNLIVSLMLFLFCNSMLNNEKFIIKQK